MLDNIKSTHQRHLLWKKSSYFTRFELSEEALSYHFAEESAENIRFIEQQRLQCHIITFCFYSAFSKKSYRSHVEFGNHFEFFGLANFL
jgi:hypothetical protein